MPLNYDDGALLDAVRTIRWPARRLARGGILGAHLSRVRGYAQEFTEYRAYRQGDETRRIDWKLLGRTDRAYIRLSTERTLLPTVLIVDASASLAYPAESLEKWHHARQLAIGLAATALAGGDPVGLRVATNAQQGSVGLPVRARRGVVQEVADTLGSVVPAGTVDLASLLRELRAVARVAVISDFLDDASSLLDAAGHLAAAGKEVHAVHVVHADELEPPLGSALLVDPERESVRRTLSEANRAAYIEGFAAWRTDLANAWRARGAWYTQAATSEPVAKSVRRIVLGAHAENAG